MENSNFKKQAKSDIFKELNPIINFYVSKGAKPKALKKYYKNSKRFNELLDDIKNKGVNLVEDESEYKGLVKEILHEILDDFIAHEKDEQYKQKKETKMKHIKEFNSFNQPVKPVNEIASWLLGIGAGYFFYKFIKGLIQDIKYSRMTIDDLQRKRLEGLASMVGRRVRRGEKIEASENIVYYVFKVADINIKINKNENYITWYFDGENSDDKQMFQIKLTKDEIQTLIDGLREDLEQNKDDEGEEGEEPMRPKNYKR